MYQFFDERPVKIMDKTLDKLDVLESLITRHWRANGFGPSIRWLWKGLRTELHSGIALSHTYYLLRLGVHLGRITHTPDVARSWRVVSKWELEQRDKKESGAVAGG